MLLCRRWQAVALASSSAVVALAGPGRQECLSSFNLLPLALLPWPGVRDLLLRAPVGRSAVRHALTVALVRTATLREV